MLQPLISNPARDLIVVAIRKHWMNVIKAPARWRWRSCSPLADPACLHLSPLYPHATRLIMTREEFLRLAAQGYNRIPLSFETLADFDTPLSLYLKLADAPYSYLLESAQGGEKWGRYSIIGLPCRTILRAYEHRVTVSVDEQQIEQHDCDDPLAFVEAFKERY